MARPSGPTKLRLRLPAETEGRVEILGSGADAAPAVVDLLERIGVLNR
jgi:electron transfer flavoprotein beta subunit